MVKDFAFDNNCIWVASDGGGLVKIDVLTGSSTFYYKSNSGIPSVRLTSVIVDQQNNIWMGSIDCGLIKFDGISQWTAFNTANSLLIHNKVQSLYLDDSNGIWIGTWQGISYLKNSNWTSFNNSFLDNVIDFAQDKNGILWAACQGANGGLARYMNITWSCYSSAPLVGNIDVFDITIDTGNVLWGIDGTYMAQPYTILTPPQKLFLKDNNVWDTLEFPPSACVKVNSLMSIEADMVGNIWFAGNIYDSLCPGFGFLNSNCIYLISNPFIRSNPTYNNYISHIKIDSAGKIWFAGYGGLARYDPVAGSWDDYSKNLISSISAPGIFDLKIRKSDQSVWAATGWAHFIYYQKYVEDHGLGLSSFDGSQWDIFNDHNTSIPANTISSIEFDDQDHVWFTSFNSHATPGPVPTPHIIKYDGTQFVDCTPQSTGLSGDSVFTRLAKDTTGNIWSGTTDGRLYQNTGLNWQLSYNFGWLTYPIIYSAYFDINGSIWCGTMNDLINIKPGGIISVYATKNFSPASPTHNVPLDFLNDKNGNLWLVTYGELICIDDKSNWTFFTKYNSGLPNAPLSSLSLDSTDKLWIGTYGGGLVAYDYLNNSWAYFNTLNSGLTQDYITSIEVDNMNNVLIGTPHAGICVYLNNQPVSIQRHQQTGSSLWLTIAPNPIKTKTSIRFSINSPAIVNLSIFNNLGQCIRTLMNDNCGENQIKIDWNCEDKNGNRVAPGIYYCVLRTGCNSLASKLVVIR